MPKGIQLNLFGDYIALDTDPPPTTEVTNAQSLVKNGQIPLERTSSGLLSETAERGHSGTETPGGRGEGKGDVSGTDGARDEKERGTGDSSSTVYSTDTGEKPGLILYHGTRRGNIIESFNFESVNYGVSANAFAQGNSCVYFTENYTAARYFSRKAGQFNALRDHDNPQVLDNAWEMLFGENDGNVVTVRLPEDTKIKELDYYPDAEEIQKIKEQGYDGAAFLEVGLKHVEDYPHKRLPAGEDVFNSKTTVVFYPEKIQVLSNSELSPDNNLKSTPLPRSPGVLRNGHTDDMGNYHITADDRIGAGGKVAKFEANTEAIRVLKLLEEQKRYATPDEQSRLVLYTGWGGLSEVFKKEPEGLWVERQRILKELLTDQEYRSASRSTMNAHYTSPQVIGAVWSAVERLGYKGGPTLEPAAGTGLFFGLRPVNLPVEMHGIELDSISGRIAQQLYQSANIKVSGYEDIKMPENRYNLVISNVPFGGIKPYEESKNQTPGLDNRYSIHDFYFLKSLYGTRPGGVIAFITSRYTLDKEETEVRRKIAEKADFLGSMRLPNNSFKRVADTEVVTDIVFLQKRFPDQPMSEQTKAFIKTEEISLPSPDGQIRKVHVNSYYSSHPGMILGTQDLSGSMYQGNEYTVSLPEEELQFRLTGAIGNLPENVIPVMIDERTRELDSALSEPLSHIDADKIPHGTFVIGLDTRLYQKDIETNEIILSPLYENEAANKEEIVRIMRMATIRDCVKDSFEHYYSGQQLEVNRDLSRLNSLYDSFVKEYGYLNSRKNVYAFNDDPDSALLQSLEIWDPKSKSATKAEIFDGISFVKKEPVTSVDSPLDAMILSLSRYGSLNLSYMESLTGSDREQLIDKLLLSGHIYQDPQDYVNNGKASFITADEYLSGNVREKLKFAKLAEVKEPAVFSRNVSALQQVMPKDVEAQDISLRINSPIVGEKHVKGFVEDVFDAYRVDVIHVPITGKWEVKGSVRSAINNETFGTHRISALEILNSIMNGKPVKVYDRLEKEDRLVLNQEETSAAELKAEQINSAFDQWLWKDKDRTEDIVSRYNQVYNSHIERKFTHPERMIDQNADIRFHGCNFPFPMRPHQADAVWRVLQQKNTMLAHTVGAGKTLEMACSAMELRRLGLRNKPMIVCPDHMIGQWSAEFRAAYPSAKLLIADDQNWDRENRRTFVNKIATGDWDSVIIRAESFKMIPMSPEYQQEFFWKKIAEYQEILNATDSAHKKSRSVKDLEKAIVKYKDKIKELSDMERDEGVIPFDKLGVDHLFIDEADLYKNLEYYTQLQNVRGLGTPKGSERALDMLMKIRHIQESDGGITFATGTPVSNTLVEAYTMQRFLQPEVLKANGLEAFDEWARQYAESVTQMELNNTGTGYTPVTRFSKIVNVPELVTSLRQTWDIQTAHNLEASGILVPGINLPRMRIVNEAAPSTPLLRSYLKFLEQREKELKGKPEKGSDNILSIMTDGRKAAIDMRLINPHLPDDPNSKLNLGVRVIHDVYSRFKSEGYTCAVFFDKARSFDPADPSRILFDGVKEMKNKLISQGIRPEEISDVRECKSFDERRALFEKVNDGCVRVIFGSTETMGAGTNFQTNLKAIVHVDAPWRPRDIEQQNGRGYRPGNRTGELEVYNLVTKGSLDTGLWNVLETKAGSIRQVMDGTDKTTRQIEENYYGSVKELSIDNELMKEAVELDHSLRKLKSQNRSHVNEVAHAHRMLQSIPADIEKDGAQIAKIKVDMGMRQAEAKGDEFRVILENKEFSERKEAGTFIKATAQTMFLQAKTKGDNIEQSIGTYSGMNLVLRTSLYDPYSIGRIIACGQNFRYSAEIRTDSDPVGICRSLHNQIYRGMEKMLEQYQAAIVTKRANLKEFSRLSQAVFPKQKELEDKEKRYTEVLKLLENESKEKGPETVGDKMDIPWSRLSEMGPEEVHNSVRFFLDANSIEPVPETVDKISGISDLEKAVRDKYSINLPPSVLSAIVSSVNKGQIGLQSMYSDICATIEKTRSTVFTWQMPEKAERYAVFSKDPLKSSPGDVVVRKVTAGAEERFDAYRILEGGVSKFLGSEREFEGMRKRVEKYVVCWEVRERVNEAILFTENIKDQKKRAIELQL